MAKEKYGTALRRFVITEEEKARVFEECDSAPFSGHAGRDPMKVVFMVWYLVRIDFINFLSCQEPIK